MTAKGRQHSKVRKTKEKSKEGENRIIHFIERGQFIRQQENYNVSKGWGFNIWGSELLCKKKICD